MHGCGLSFLLFILNTSLTRQTLLVDMSACLLWKMELCSVIILWINRFLLKVLYVTVGDGKDALLV